MSQVRTNVRYCLCNHVGGGLGLVVMGFHRSPDRLAAARQWGRFVERNAHVIDRAGLPPAVTASIANWDAFLMHGSLASDPAEEFTVAQLTPDQYASLVALATTYFAAGYEFYAPSALRPVDQEQLRARFFR